VVSALITNLFTKKKKKRRGRSEVEAFVRARLQVEKKKGEKKKKDGLKRRSIFGERKKKNPEGSARLGFYPKLAYPPGRNDVSGPISDAARGREKGKKGPVPVAVEPRWLVRRNEKRRRDPSNRMKKKGQKEKLQKSPTPPCR